LIIATGTTCDGRQLIVLGLTRGNINKLLRGDPICLERELCELVPAGWEITVLFAESDEDLTRELTSSGEIAAAPSDMSKKRRRSRHRGETG
jgi:hypothetical protein